MDQAKNWIHCDGAYRLGLTGKGVGVAVLDTGIFLTGILRIESSALQILSRGEESLMTTTVMGRTLQGL